ncbi:MAG: hypothetical protein Q8O42_09630 [Acidobacteriota bacterium]|nr:hypothetical protein [Acidobacteriota bacterium]
MIELTADQRTTVFEIKHPAYVANVASWSIFLDAYDGQGGFLDGEYLDRYPREVEAEFTKRKAAARYHNYSETLCNLYSRKIFSRPIERRVSDEDLKAWLTNVDGAGTDMSTFVSQVLTRALAAGHCGALCDMTQAAPTGPSKADQQAAVYLTQYLPPDIQDWRVEADGSLAAVKLREQVDSTNLLDAHADGDEAVRMLLWDRESWVRVPHRTTDAIESDVHLLGLVPFAVLTPKPLQRWPLVGKSLLGNANVIRALFNRAAEEDQVLRDQAFSMLTINVPAEGDVEKVKTQLGSETGTTRALVTQGQADYIAADMNVPKAIRDNIAYLVQEIYRMAFMKSTRESLEAESAEAIRLKHDELNDYLVSIADQCERLEKQLIRFWCAWTSASEEQAQAKFDSLDLTINYAQEFFLTDIEQDLKAWAVGLKMELGKTMEKRLRLRAAHRLEPNLSEDEKAEVEKEIEAIASKPKPDPAAMVEGLRAAAAAAARMPKPGQTIPPAKPDEGAGAGA